MIIEIRRYTLKSGRREEFIDFFETVNRPTLVAAGMKVFGPMRDLNDKNVVHWMRAFETQAAQTTIKDAFYDGPVWIKDIEPVVMPMIDHYEASIVEATGGFLGFRETPEV